MSPTADPTKLDRLLGRTFEFEGVDAVTRGDIRRKLEVYCSDCPIHYDDEVAQSHGFKGAVAPATLAPLLSTPGYWHPGEPLFFAPDAPFHGGWLRMEELQAAYSNGVNVSSAWEYHEPLYPGDRLHGTWTGTQIKPRTTRLGEGVFFTYELKLWNQAGDLVAVNTNTNFQYEPGPPAPPPAVATTETEPVTHELPPLTTPDFDWGPQRRFEHVEIGESVEPFVMWLSSQRIVMGIACDRMFHNVHFERDFARGMGLDDIIFNTRGYEGGYEVMLRRWMGLDGRLLKLGPFKMMQNGYPGDTLSFQGRVTGKQQLDPVSVVDLEVWVTSNRGETSRGVAQVSLPTADYGGVWTVSNVRTHNDLGEFDPIQPRVRGLGTI